jgi:hypothetical protein
VAVVLALIRHHRATKHALVFQWLKQVVVSLPACQALLRDSVGLLQLRQQEGGKRLERVKGIEPSYSAWKAAALPLSYTRARPINYHASRAASTAMR